MQAEHVSGVENGVKREENVVNGSGALIERVLKKSFERERSRQRAAAAQSARTKLPTLR